ncbi:MAG: bifunctional UDP-sugar hydrolase/5'-nucleotidase [Candidatus Shapirobacteria bacterium]|nr:bifunctional UDP-sugar hydrolase/5'-nucleotidase [Candidatus Shapirobacteria bacterium]
MATKKFTILHSNDMHGDFLAEIGGKPGQTIGGLALLSAYINKVRTEEENVLYVISGDMVQGSLIDTEYKGISTIEIMNFLAPDVVALGNHEFDYGLPHLLFLEKMANFPIVNANLYVKNYHRRLMNPYKIIKKAGMDILFTGIITDKVIDSISQDKLIGSFVSLEEASSEVGKICNAYKNDDIDLTILLTHIGFDSDKQLAALLKPEWGVDIIIGGHSHTVLEKPEIVNNILIIQAGTSTNQVGRFDIIVDDDTNSIVESKWQLIPITSDIVAPDEALLKFIEAFKTEVDTKYSAILTKFSEKLTHPLREIETSLGNLFADAFADAAQCDVAFVGSGSIRIKEMGPVVTLNDLMSCFPYNDSLTRFTITGLELKNIFSHFMRVENRNSEGECYQVSSKVRAVYNDKADKLESLTIDNKPIDEQKNYTICLQGYHAHNCQAYLNISQSELLAVAPSKVVSTSAQDIMIEYLRGHQNLISKVEGRLNYH